MDRCARRRTTKRFSRRIFFCLSQHWDGEWKQVPKKKRPNRMELRHCQRRGEPKLLQHLHQIPQSDVNVTFCFCISDIRSQDGKCAVLTPSQDRGSWAGREWTDGPGRRMDQVDGCTRPRTTEQFSRRIFFRQSHYRDGKLK